MSSWWQGKGEKEKDKEYRYGEDTQSRGTSKGSNNRNTSNTPPPSSSKKNSAELHRQDGPKVSEQDSKLHELTKERDKLTELNEQLRTDLDSSDRQIAQHIAKSDGLQAEVNQLLKKIKEWEGYAHSTKIQLDTAEREITEYKRNISELQRKNRDLETTTKAQNTEITNLDQELGKSKGEVSELTATKRRQQNEINDVKGNNTRLSDENTSLQQSLSATRKQVTQLQNELTSTKDDAAELQRKNGELETTVKAKKKEITLLENDISKFKGEVGELSATKRRQENEINDLNGNNSKLSNEVASLQQTLSSSRKQVTELKEEVGSTKDKLEKAQSKASDYQKQATEWQGRASALERELEESKLKGAMLQGNVKVAIDYIHAVLKVRPAFADTLQDILLASGEGPAQQVVTHAQQVASQSGNRESTEPRVAKPAPVVFETSIQPRFSVKVPVFCAKNVADLPDVVDICNEMGGGLTPSVSFHLTPYDSAPDGGPEVLGIVLALASTDRVDIVDRELVANLREKKGCAEVLLIILRRGNDPSKFKPSNDDTIPSGVKNEKVLFQLVHFKGKVLMDADANKKAISKFFDYVKLALPK